MVWTFWRFTRKVDAEEGDDEGEESFSISDNGSRTTFEETIIIINSYYYYSFFVILKSFNFL